MMRTVLLKPEKLAFGLPVTYQTQSAETGIESVWALHSDGRRPEKMVGLAPTHRLTFPSQPALSVRGQECGEGVWDSGERPVR